MRPIRLVAAALSMLAVSPMAWAAQSYAEAASASNPDKGDRLTAAPALPQAPHAPVKATSGALTFYTVEATFDAAFPGLPTETFEAGNAPPGGFSTCDAPLDSAGDGPCGFAAGEILDGVAFQDNPGPAAAALILLGAGTSLNASQALIANTFSDAFDIVFNPPVSAAGMFLHSTPGPGQGPPDTLTIQVFDGSNVSLGTDNAAAASGPGNFWGVSSPTPIGRISMLSQNARAEGVDNIRFSGEPTLVVSDLGTADQCAMPVDNVNGIPEPGEALQFTVELTASSGDFTGIGATLSSSDPNVTIIDGSATYPDLTSGSSANGDAPFVVVLDPATPCFSQVDFDLSISSNEGTFPAAFSNTVGASLTPAGLPAAIPDNAPAGTSSDLVVADDVTLTDVDVRVAITHTWVGDLILTLEAPDNTMIVLLDRPGVPASAAGCSDDNMNVTFDDSSGVDAENHCAASNPWLVGSAAPVGSLAALNGMSSAGTWTLHVSDNAGQDLGTIDDWELITTPPIGGACDTCADPGVGGGPGPGPNPLEIPTLDWRGLLALALLVAAAATVALRR